jgi:hypothetical protein
MVVSNRNQVDKKKLIYEKKKAGESGLIQQIVKAVTLVML